MKHEGFDPYRHDDGCLIRDELSSSNPQTDTNSLIHIHIHTLSHSHTERDTHMYPNTGIPISCHSMIRSIKSTLSDTGYDDATKHSNEQISMLQKLNKSIAIISKSFCFGLMIGIPSESSYFISLLGKKLKKQK